MELRWYWRVLQRQWRIIWITIVVVAALALAYSVYTYLGSSYKAGATIQFYEQQPNLGGNSAGVNPQGISDAAAFDARDTSKQYTEGIPYFKRISAVIKAKYGQTVDWKVIQAHLGATPDGGRAMLLEYTGSDSALDAEAVNAAIDVLVADFLPTYRAEHVTAPSSIIRTFPMQVDILSPVDGKAASKTTILTGWLLKSLVGIVLGIALAFLWEYIDESIHDEQDVRTWMGTPTLGLIPGGKGRAA